MNEKAERINGWAAMIGIVAAFGLLTLWNHMAGSVPPFIKHLKL